MPTKEELVIKIKIEDLRDKLERIIVSEHSSLIADVLIANLQKSEVGLRQCFLALSGIKETAKFNVLDRVLVPKDSVYSWEYSPENTEKAGLLHKGQLAGFIREIDLQKENSYDVEVTVMDLNEKLITLHKWLKANQITKEPLGLI